MNASLSEPPTQAATASTGLRTLRTAVAVVLAIGGALALAIAAGAAMNPPTSDSVTYEYTVTNTSEATFDRIRVSDPTVTDLDATISCPQGSLEPGEQLTCDATVAGPADRSHASRVTAALLFGVAALTAGVAVRPRR